MILLFLSAFFLYADGILVGQWYCNCEGEEEIFAFYADGTGVWAMEKAGMEDPFTYEFDGKVLIILWEWSQEFIYYDIILDHEDAFTIITVWDDGTVNESYFERMFM